MDFILHPMYLFLVSFVIVIIIIEECYQRGTLNRWKLGFALVDIFAIGAFWLFSKNGTLFYKENGYSILGYIYMGFSVIDFAVLVILMAYVASFGFQKANSYSKFIDSLNNTTWNIYMITDRRDRIKEISSGLLADIGLEKKEVLGRKAFDVFDQTIRFTRVDDNELTNKELREYYKTFNKTSRDREEYKREIYLKNCNGQTVVLNIVERAIFINKHYRGRMIVGQKKNDLSLLNVEKELVSRNKELESIQYKFIASLELSEEGIFFNDLNENFIWGNDVFVKDLHLNSNTISTMDYRNLICSDDRETYARTLAELTPENPTYHLTYRIMVGNTLKFVKETGKRIFEDESSDVILGYTKVLENNYFQKTTFADLDNCKTMDDMMADLDGLYADRKIFQLVCINLSSIPDINEKHGRGVGNLVMAEYIKQLKHNFITESSNIYRSTGLTFYFTITDPRKMELFKRGLQSSNNAMNMRIDYGSININLNVHIGIADGNDDGYNKEELLMACNKSITTALNPNYNLNYAYYKDLKSFNI